jgi:hypothetical protein
MLLVGILLVSGLGMIIVESPGYNRGGYDGKFWKLPLDDKLDHVVENKKYWWWISVWGLVGVLLMTSGLMGFTYLLADAGEPVLAYVAIGGYLVALMAWVMGMVLQAPVIVKAATERADTGGTPGWLHPFWDTGYLAEGVWILGANLAYAVMGLAILQSGLVGTWAGWAALVLGLLIPIAIVITKAGFPQLAEVVPFIVGIALIIESV